MSANGPDRYHRQQLLSGIGSDGQQRLRQSHALVVGCGALGCAIVDILARAGVGRLTIVDRDIVEWTNLQRQTLFTERDAREDAPKATAARRRVEEINSDVQCRGWVEHFGPENALQYARDCDVLLDGLDNLPTRFLLNDLAVSLGKPYFYGGAVATRSMAMPVLPGEACLRCIFPDQNQIHGLQTCDTAGVLMGSVLATASRQATESIKWMVGASADVDRSLWSMDAWSNHATRVSIAGARDPQCPCCGQRIFEFLDGLHEKRTVILCGRNAVQISGIDAQKTPGAGMAQGSSVQCRRSIDLAAAAALLAPHGAFQLKGNLLIGTLRETKGSEGGALELSIFADGRAIVKGTTDETLARAVYDRFVAAL